MSERPGGAPDSRAGIPTHSFFERWAPKTLANLPYLCDADAHLVRLRQPGRDDAKHAIDPGWQKNRLMLTTALDHVREHGSFLGVIPASLSLVAVDVDLPDDERPLAARAALVEKWRRQVVEVLGEPLSEVQTPGGGYHLLYKEPDTPAGRERAKGEWYSGDEKAGDIRHASGYVAMWDSGPLLYAVQQTGAAPGVDLTLLDSLSKPSADGLSPRRRGTARGARPFVMPVSPEEMAAIPPGSRNNVLFASIKDASYRGVLDADMRERYRSAAKASGLADRAVDATIGSAAGIGEANRKRYRSGPQAPVTGGEQWINPDSRSRMKQPPPPPPGSPPGGAPPPHGDDDAPAGGQRDRKEVEFLSWSVSMTDAVVHDTKLHAWVDVSAVEPDGLEVVRRRVFQPLDVEGLRSLRADLDSLYDARRYRDDRADVRNAEIARRSEVMMRDAYSVPVYDLRTQPVNQDSLYHQILGTHVPKTDFTAVFGPRKIGKSFLSRFVVMELSRRGVRVAWVDIEDVGGGAGRRKGGGDGKPPVAGGNQMASMCLAGLPSGEREEAAERICRLTPTRINDAYGWAELARLIEDHGSEYLVFDSATAAACFDLNTSTAAAGFYEKVRSLPVAGGLIINHTSKANFAKTAEDGATILGSTLWESIPRLVGMVSQPKGGDERDEAPDDYVDPEFIKVMHDFDERRRAAGESVPEKDTDGPCAEFRLKFEVSASNGPASAGEGCSLTARIYPSAKVPKVVFQCRSLQRASKEEREDARMRADMKYLVRAFKEGPPVKTSTDATDAIRGQFENGMSISRAIALRNRASAVGLLVFVKVGRTTYFTLKENENTREWKELVSKSPGGQGQAGVGDTDMEGGSDGQA